MPSLTINPSSEPFPVSTQAASPLDTEYSSATQQPDAEVPASPIAPAYSPITPRAQPALPATYSSTAEYIPEPAPRPFSDEDSTDAIALRAAISSLQFQKKKAQDDVRSLEKIKQAALRDPDRFKSELAAGRLQEQRPKIGDLRAILDEVDSDGAGDDDDEDEVVLRASTVGGEGEMKPADTTAPVQADKDNAPFDRIPGPQSVVRMPYVNWGKYHITGAPLESMHEQQRKWPGSTGYGRDRGREYAVAAPYSPWLDSLDAQGQQRWSRNDSMAVSTPTSMMTPTVSEHPMSTRHKNTQ